MKTSGVFQELKDRQYYKKPSEVKREKAKERMVNLKKAQKLRRNFLQYGRMALLVGSENKSQPLSICYVDSNIFIANSFWTKVDHTRLFVECDLA